MPACFRPFERPPIWEQIPNTSVPSKFWDQTWGSMLNAADNGVGNLTAALKRPSIHSSVCVPLHNLLADPFV